MMKNSQRRYTPKKTTSKREGLIETLKAIYFNNNLDEDFKSFEDFIQRTIFKREPEAIEIVKMKAFNE